MSSRGVRILELVALALLLHKYGPASCRDRCRIYGVDVEAFSLDFVNDVYWASLCFRLSGLYEWEIEMSEPWWSSSFV